MYFTHNPYIQKVSFCHICGSQIPFRCAEGLSLREAICPDCGTSQRTSDIVGIIINTFLRNEGYLLAEALIQLASLRIFEAQSTGIIHDNCERLSGYICSEYLDDVKPGMTNTEGVRCEDLQGLTFPDNSFDLVITQDVFEHVKNPTQAFREIYRILKPGGYHIFTIPFHEGKKTIARIICETTGENNIYPRVYHYDPLRKDGAPVYTDFGEDLINKLDPLGFTTDNICCSKWYTPDEIPSIIDEDSYTRYLKYYNSNDLCRFFKYNSWVFRSQKRGLEVR